MTYQETVQYLYDQLPAFQNSGKKAIKPSLENIESFCKELGDPHLKFKSIHVAGTNGKGSSSHMLASVFQQAGYKTGLYTSPHLKDFRERFRINGRIIDENFVVEFINEHQNLIDSLKPSFFELTVAMAFHLFAAEQVDIAIIETGLGGRLDSTNIIKPIISLITNIGFDHADVLGETLAEIAFEKAGIIKNNTPVVISEKHCETDKVFMKMTLNKNADIHFAEESFEILSKSESSNSTKIIVRDLSDNSKSTFILDLKGEYQTKNLLGVLTILKKVNSRGYYDVNYNSISKGLHDVVLNTGLKGRWQKLKAIPLVICDTGHNEHSFELLKQTLARLKYTNYHFVLGFSKDKDLQKTLGALPNDAFYYFTKFNSERAMDSEQIQIFAKNNNIINSNTYADVNVALDAAIKAAHKNDFIYVGGSTYLVAEIDNL